MIFYNYVWSICLYCLVGVDAEIPWNGGIFVSNDFW